jgi:LuxR family transcriptional regulator, maltose regulon positive regulatory protein
MKILATIQTQWMPMKPSSGSESLTVQEKRVLNLIAQGYRQKQVAERLYISMDTVKKHLQNAYRKLGANNKIEALVRARMLGDHME